MQIINYLAGFVDSYGNDRLARFVQGGLPVALLGMVTVFAVLSIIWGCLEILKYFFYTLPEMKKKEASGEAEKAPEAPAAASAPAAEEIYGSDEEIVAAIVAAITAARADEGISPSTSFRVVSFRKRK